MPKIWMPFIIVISLWFLGCSRSIDKDGDDKEDCSIQDLKQRYVCMVDTGRHSKDFWPEDEYWEILIQEDYAELNYVEEARGLKNVWLKTNIVTSNCTIYMIYDTLEYRAILARINTNRLKSNDTILKASLEMDELKVDWVIPAINMKLSDDPLTFKSEEIARYKVHNYGVGNREVMEYKSVTDGIDWEGEDI